MIKRPLDPQFVQAVRDGNKTTTIRANAWPIGVPIMLYHWSGVAYRSKHANVQPIIVDWTIPFFITRDIKGELIYSTYVSVGADHDTLWKTEGFVNRDAMDDWFRPLVKPGETITQHLMKFSPYTDEN